MLLLPAIALCEVAQPYLLKKAIDEHIAVGRLAGLERVGLAYLAALLGQYGAGFAQIYLTQLVGQTAMNDAARAGPPARAVAVGVVLRPHAGRPPHDPADERRRGAERRCSPPAW